MALVDKIIELYATLLNKISLIVLMKRGSLQGSNIYNSRRERVWEDNSMNILVSISCITYNHEKYIAQAIESFLMQKVDFEYEILIHDDASTDSTADIIREYESKYPNIIKPIYQTENQYSKGLSINATYNWPRALGNYIALCEGDDYWTNQNKLKKQVDYMEAHSECTLCFSGFEKITAEGEKNREIISFNKGDTIFSTEDIIMKIGGSFHTGSLMFPRYKIDDLPQWFVDAPVGDIPLVIMCSINGNVAYLDESMSAYRTGVVGSWTERMNNNEVANKEHRQGMIKMWNDINSYTNGKYEAAVLCQIKKYQKALLLTETDLNCLNDSINKEIFQLLSFEEKIKLYLKLCFPRFYKTIAGIKRLLNV